MEISELPSGPIPFEVLERAHVGACCEAERSAALYWMQRHFSAHSARFIAAHHAMPAVVRLVRRFMGIHSASRLGWLTPSAALVSRLNEIESLLRTCWAGKFVIPYEDMVVGAAVRGYPDSLTFRDALDYVAVIPLSLSYGGVDRIEAALADAELRRSSHVIADMLGSWISGSDLWFFSDTRPPEVQNGAFDQMHRRSTVHVDFVLDRLPLADLRELGRRFGDPDSAVGAATASAIARRQRDGTLDALLLAEDPERLAWLAAAASSQQPHPLSVSGEAPVPRALRAAEALASVGDPRCLAALRFVPCVAPVEWKYLEHWLVASGPRATKTEEER